LAQQGSVEGADLALEAARAASGKKAERIVLLDVSELLAIIDYFVICSGNTERQVRTIADEVERRLLSTRGVKPRRREGSREARWVVLDYIDFAVHVFRNEERDYYDLERLWADAPRIPFTEPNPQGSSAPTSQEEHDEPATAEAT
jgi:ribosome-associated protein